MGNTHVLRVWLATREISWQYRWSGTIPVLALSWHPSGLAKSVPFLVGEGLKWDGPRSLKRRPESYKQFSVTLEGTKEVHSIALPASAHIAEGILHPPDLPSPPKQGKIEAADAQKRPMAPPPSPSTTVDRTRFVLGNWNEEYPHERSFLGTLYGMRVLFLHKDEEYPSGPTSGPESGSAGASAS